MGEKTTKKFVAIFNTLFGNVLSFYKCAIINYDNVNGVAKINAGEFKDKEEGFFNILKGNPNFIFGQGEKISIVNNFSNYSIYIFENDFIEELTSKNSWTPFEAYKYITSNLLSLKLDGINNGMFESNKMSILTPWVYNDDRMKSMLYGNTAAAMTSDGDSIFVDSSKDIENIFDIDLKKSDKDNNKPSDFFKKIDINKIINDISKKVVGQERAIKSLVCNIYYNQLLIDEYSSNKNDLLELDSRKVTILLDGTTGTGKTQILKYIEKELDIPVIITSIANYTAVGVVGSSITDVLKKLLDEAHGDLSKAERGIIVFDEIDKIVSREDIDVKNMKKSVQEELLSFISGSDYDIKKGDMPTIFGSQSIKFNTSKITFILSGAFTDLKERKIEENEAKYKSIGFSNTKSDDTDHDRSYIVTPEDYIEEGLMREFFGRIKLITSTKTYNYDDYKNILLNSELSPLLDLEKSAKALKFKGITYDDEFVDAFAKKAVELNTGARGLHIIAASIRNKYILESIIEENNNDREIVLTKKMVDEYYNDNLRRY